MILLFKKIYFYIFDLCIYYILILSQLSYRRPIFIITIPYGRWGNRLILYSYIIAWANKYNCIVMNPSFSEYSYSFSYFKNNPLCLLSADYNLCLYIFKLFSNIFQNSLKRTTLRSSNLPSLYKIDLENKFVNTDTIDFPKILSSKRIIFFYGFLFGDRDFSLINNQRKYLSHLFLFSDHIKKKCIEIIKLINKKKIIGVCMRQGDYKDYSKGNFFLSDSEYHNLVSRLQIQYPDHGFFIACEEEKNDFQINNTFISYQNPALNLCVLSYCDILIGPPSTFMTWAAFYRDSAVCYIDKFTWDRQHYTFTPVTF